MAYSINAKDYFNTVLYNGTGSSQSITGVGFQPDWLWQKSRSNTQDGRIFDAVRGGSKLIYPSLTNAESTDAQLITSFDSDGFTMGSSGSNVNDSGTTNVAWNWRASNTTAVSNTDGDITSTVSANTTSGFSIVKYTGNGSASNIGHGLGSAPKCIIIKKTSATADWLVGHNELHPTLPWKYGINLSNSSARHESGSYFADTTPTASVFRVEANDEVNTSGQTYIAYCFAEKTGFSKFGSYIGNGQASDNAFCYCGFKPQFILQKNVDAGENWIQWDTPRNTAVNYDGNPTQVIFEPNTSGAESNASARAIDVLSNGFKIKGNNANYGGSGTRYIFIAFAEAPLVGTNNIPATAR